SRIRAFRPRILIQPEAVIGRRMRPLSAFQARTDPAAHPDRHGLLIVGKVDTVRIDHFPGMMDGAAQPDREVAPGGVIAVIALGDGAGGTEIALSGRHLADLNIDALRRAERRIDVPARTGAGMARDTESRERTAPRDGGG